MFIFVKTRAIVRDEIDQPLRYPGYNSSYRKDPKFSDSQVYTNRKPRSDCSLVTSLIRVYIVVIPSAHLCMHYSIIEQEYWRKK